MQDIDGSQKVYKCFIKVKFSDFSRSSAETLSQQLSLDLCQQLLEQVWEKHRKPIRLLGLGVRFKELTPKVTQQLPLVLSN